MSKKSLLIVASLAYDGIETKENKVDNILGGAGTYLCLSLKHFDNNCSIILVFICYCYRPGNDHKRRPAYHINCLIDNQQVVIHLVNYPEPCLDYLVSQI